MTKEEFVASVSLKSGLSKKEASAAVDAFLDSVTDALRNGDEIAFTGFGKFAPQHQEAPAGMRAELLREDAAKVKEEGKAFRTEIEDSLKTLESLSS